MNIFEMVDELNKRYDCPTPDEAYENATHAARTFCLWMKRWDASRPHPGWLVGFAPMLDQKSRAYVDVMVSDPRRLRCLPRHVHGVPVVGRVAARPSALCRGRDSGLGQIPAAPAEDWGAWYGRLEAAGEAASSGSPEGAEALDALPTVLHGRATSIGATPVALAAARLQSALAAAKAAPGDAAKAADAKVALEEALEAIRREAISSVEDRIRAEESIERRMDRFEDRLRAWKSENSGFGAIKNFFGSGPDVKPLQDELDSIKSAVERTPLTREGRRRLLERHAQIVPTVKAGDAKFLLFGALGIIGWQVLVSGAGAATRVGVMYAAEKRKKKRRPKDDIEDDED